jgi:hypothetical protein
MAAQRTYHREKFRKSRQKVPPKANQRPNAHLKTTQWRVFQLSSQLQKLSQVQESYQVKLPFVTFPVFSNIFPDVPMANSDQEPQKDLPSNPPSSDTVKDTPHRTIHEANRQEHKLEKSRKRARDEPSKGNGELRSLHSRD